MIELTEPQVWVLIGVFAASTFGMITIVAVSFTRTLNAAMGGVRSEISGLESGLRGEIAGLEAGLRGEISGLRGEMNARFEAVDAKFDAMDAKFSGKFEVLDRDIQALSRRVFGRSSSGALVSIRRAAATQPAGARSSATLLPPSTTIVWPVT